MSNILPLTQLKKFRELDSEVLENMHINFLSGNGAYTNIRPRTANLIYFGCHIDNNNTYCIELEYKNKLMIFLYNMEEPKTINYMFCTEWEEDEVLEGTDDMYIDVDIDEGGFFQQSLINDFGFLTYNLHTELYQYVHEIDKKFNTRIDEYNKNTWK